MLAIRQFGTRQPGSRRLRKRHGAWWLLPCLIGALAGAGPSCAEERAGESEQVRFARDVRPILAEHCFACHGPDEKKRQADLRLDLESGARQPIDGRVAVVPGDLAKSELWRRVTADDDARMPPEDTGRRLTARQRDVLRRWIEQGASWEQHWSLIPPASPPLPPTLDRAWIRTPIDAFVLDRLESERLSPSPEAEKSRLLRRVTLDLTGIPPTPRELAEYLGDDSPDAYERVVERLLASPRYGERMAWIWLDAARYADTSGYQNDGPRVMWRWRDWVIDAFNRNMPFDQFTLEQVAGDLLPDATLDQRIATGFNRNHRGNAEGGIIPAEYHVEYVVDRVDTTCTVWLGLTMGCARCHDHKYDPLSQRDFYRVFAYFNNIPEHGRAIKEGNSPPYVLAPTPEQARSLATIDQQIAAAEKAWEGVQEARNQAQLAWEQSPEAATLRHWTIERGLTAVVEYQQRAVTGHSHSIIGELRTRRNADVSPLNQRIDVVGSPEGSAVRLDGTRFVDAGDVGNFGYFDKFSFATWVRPTGSMQGTILSRMTDEEQGDGWYVQLHEGHIQVNLVKRWLDDAIRVQSRRRIPPDAWTHVAVTYDGSRQARGVSLFLDGQPAEMAVHLDFINQTFAVKEPLRIGAGNGPQGGFSGDIGPVRIFQRALSAEEIAILSSPEPISALVARPRERRTTGELAKIAACFLAQAAPPIVQDIARTLLELRDKRQSLIESLPTVMVMEEKPHLRETHLLVRGEYDKPGEKVTPGIPQCFFGSGEPAPDSVQDRLGFARWLIDRRNPLTARVAVNRLWQMHFGSGLVRTTEDFGSQGEPPSHPELLDWLAVEFIDSGWDLKHVHRLIVASATYRQTSTADPAALARDAENRLLARGPRFRLSAEMIRDQALASSGLLIERIGGPSVKPYQPEDLWKDLATDNTYVQDHGANLYRRSLYTYWKRTVAPPSMMTFDAAGREACQVRYARTNTPMQALVLMNEVTYVEAARALAQRILAEAGDSVPARLQLLFQLVTSRPPADAELRVLVESLDYHLQQFRREPERAEKLLSQGEWPRDTRRDACELAAYTTVASLVLNLDEVVTRQ